METPKEQLFSSFYNRGILVAKNDDFLNIINNFMHDDVYLAAERIHEYIMQCHDRDKEQGNIDHVIMEYLSSALLIHHDNIREIHTPPYTDILRIEYVLRAIGQHIECISDTGDTSLERFIPGIIQVVEWSMTRIYTNVDEDENIIDVLKSYGRLNDDFIDAIYGVVITLHDDPGDFTRLIELWWLSQAHRIEADYSKFCKYFRLFYPIDFNKMKSYLTKPADEVDSWVETMPQGFKEAMLHLK